MIPYLIQKSKGCFGKKSLFYSESKPASLWGHLRPSFFSFAIPSFGEYRCRISPVFRPFLPKNRCVCETVCEDALLRPSAPMTHPGRSPAPTAPDFFAAVSPGGGCDPPSPHQDMVSITFSNRSACSYKTFTKQVSSEQFSISVYSLSPTSSAE